MIEKLVVPNIRGFTLQCPPIPKYSTQALHSPMTDHDSHKICPKLFDNLGYIQPSLTVIPGTATPEQSINPPKPTFDPTECISFDMHKL